MNTSFADRHHYGTNLNVLQQERELVRELVKFIHGKYRPNYLITITLPAHLRRLSADILEKHTKEVIRTLQRNLKDAQTPFIGILQFDYRRGWSVRVLSRLDTKNTPPEIERAAIKTAKDCRLQNNAIKTSPTSISAFRVLAYSVREMCKGQQMHKNSSKIFFCDR